VGPRATDNPEADLSERKGFAEMAGEQLREAGVLILVFAPLYEVFEGSKASGLELVAALLIALGLMATGMEVERRREI